MGSNPAIEDAAQVATRQLCLNRNLIVTKSRRRKILMMPRYLSNEISTDRFFSFKKSSSYQNNFLIFWKSVATKKNILLRGLTK